MTPEITTELTIAEQTEIKKAFEVQEMEIKQYKNAYEHIIKQELSPELSTQARSLRLELRKERSAVNKTHKVRKNYFLQGGRYVDAQKNVLVDMLQNMESKLLEIEEYELRLEKARQEKLQAERSVIISKYTENIPENLGEMDDGMFDAIVIGLKSKWESEQAEIKAKELEEAKVLESQKVLDKRKFDIQKYAYVVDLEMYDLNLNTSEAEYKEILKDLESKKHEHDLEAKQMQIRNERKSKLLEYWSFISDEIKAMDLSELNEEEFRNIGNDAHKFKVAQDKKEAEEKARHAKQLAEFEAKEKARIELERKEKEAEELKIKEAEELRKSPTKQQLKSWLDALVLEDAPVKNDVSADISKRFEGFKKWAEKQIDNL